MSQLQLKFVMGAGTAVLFLGAIGLNELLFARFEFAAGISWIYLPAGVRLLCTLLFAEAVALGILVASWLTASSICSRTTRSDPSRAASWPRSRLT